MAIYANVGTPGSGKSYDLVATVLHKYAKSGLHPTIRLADGRPAPRKWLYANFQFLPDNVYRLLTERYRYDHRDALIMVDRIRPVKTLADLVAVSDGILAFDEAHGWLPSRGFRIIPQALTAFWSQHRKVGISVYLATQRLESVDTGIRELVAEVWHARPAPMFVEIPARLASRNKRPAFAYRLLVDEVVGKVGRNQSVADAIGRFRMRWLDSLTASCYDSLQIFDSPFNDLAEKMDDKLTKAAREMGIIFDNSRLLLSSHTPPAPWDRWTAAELLQLLDAGLTPEQYDARQRAQHLAGEQEARLVQRLDNARNNPGPAMRALLASRAAHDNATVSGSLNS